MLQCMCVCVLLLCSTYYSIVVSFNGDDDDGTILAAVGDGAAMMSRERMMLCVRGPGVSQMIGIVEYGTTKNSVG